MTFTIGVRFHFWISENFKLMVSLSFSYSITVRRTVDGITLLNKALQSFSQEKQVQLSNGHKKVPRDYSYITMVVVISLDQSTLDSLIEP